MFSGIEEIKNLVFSWGRMPKCPQDLPDHNCLPSITIRDFPGKESASQAGDTDSIPGSGRSLEKEVANHSSILAWKTPWTEEPGGLQSMGSQRVRHDLATKSKTSSHLWHEGARKLLGVTTC